MKSFYMKLKDKFFHTEIKSSYDLYNTEILNITNPPTYSGIRTEISKTVSPYFQISHISSKGTDFNSKQTYGTFCFNNLLLQTSIDQDKTYRIRGTHMYNSLFTKFHTVIGKSVIGQGKDIFSQIEIDLRNEYNNLCIKLIQPAIKGASCIYIGNYMQQLGIVSLGGEIIKADEYLGFSFVGRCETPKSVSTLSLQQFNTLSVDYYRKVSHVLDLGFKVSTTLNNEDRSFNNEDKFLNYGLGIKVHTSRGVIIGSLDNNKIVSVVYNDKLSEGLTLNMSYKMGKNLFEYGYGFIYEF